MTRYAIRADDDVPLGVECALICPSLPVRGDAGATGSRKWLIAIASLLLLLGTWQFRQRR